MLQTDARCIDRGLLKTRTVFKSAAYTMTDRDFVVGVTTTTANVFITLPDAKSVEGETLTIFAESLTNPYSVGVYDPKGAIIGGMLRDGDSMSFYSNGRSFEAISDPVMVGRYKYFLETFDNEIVSSGKAGGGSSGTEGDENVMATGRGNLEWHVLGTQTILAPSIVSTGLNINQDQTDDDGIEICAGILAGNRLAYTVGTDSAFFIKCYFSIADVSGTDDCAVGFRKAEAYQANIDDYDEMACLNVISGDITIETILNDGATTATDTTDNWADATLHELEVRVSDAGVVTYLIDGAAPTTTAAFTFDDGEVVVPFIYFLNATDVAGEVVINKLEIGYQY